MMPQSPPRFLLWRRSAVVTLSAASAVCTLEGVRDLLPSHCGSAFEFPARVQRGPLDDVVVGNHSFIFELLSAEGQSLLVGNGAFFDLHLALDVVNRVGLLHPV